MKSRAIAGACVGAQVVNQRSSNVRAPTASPRAGRSADEDVAAAARSLFTLGRAFARQSTRDLLRERSGPAVELSRVLVVQAVDEGLRESDDDVTVGTIAARLAIDPSTASRLVSETLRDGYIARSASARDARRACLSLTRSGRELVRSSRAFQQRMFLEATAAWTDEERSQFAGLFVRFADAVTRLHTDVAGRRDDCR